MNDTSPREAISIDLPTPSLSKGEREYQAFVRLLPTLLQTHRGRYVAIHDGQVVDQGDDDIELVQRVHLRIGNVPIYVGLVSAEQRVFRIPHYREHRRREK